MVPAAWDRKELAFPPAGPNPKPGAKSLGIIQAVKVVVHDRTEEVPDRVRAYAEQRLLRVWRHFDRVVEAEVEFARESGRSGEAACAVRITVHLDGRRHPLAQARELGSDPKATLDRALDKVDRQVLKLKEKIKVEKKRRLPPESKDSQGSLRRGAQAPGHPGAADGQVVVYQAPERIRMKLRPQTLEEAAAALDGVEHPFYVFLDESSGGIAVCFRRPDGQLAVIEPVID